MRMRTALVFLLLLVCACSSHRYEEAAPALPALPAREAFQAPKYETKNVSDMQFSADALASGSASGEGAQIYAVQQAARHVVPGVLAQGFGGAAKPSGPPMTLPAVDASKSQKIEIEAQYAFEVKDIDTAAARVRALVVANGGQTTKDDTSQGQYASCEILARIPSERFDAFAAALVTIGPLKNKSVKVADTTLENRDTEVLVANLRAALDRYREILKSATDPLQVLALEKELERVRTDLDRVEARLSYLRDRAARATVAIAIRGPKPEGGVETGEKPIVAPGVRGVSLIDVREGGTNVYLGAALSFRLPQAAGDSGRGLVLDVDVMRACCKTTPDRSLFAYDVLAGIDLYSTALEAGRRRWLNPYLGLRAGFAQSQDRPDFAAAGVFGLELLKTTTLALDIQTRLMALLGNPDGPHAGIQPTLGFDLGF